MEKNLVGYRFSPTGEELINHYLKNKILDKPWLVDEAISEINICAYNPEDLPSLSKLESKDPVWYFFTPREYTAPKKKGTKRTTPSGFWKVTGPDTKVREKRGYSVVIGIKKPLVYFLGRSANGVKTRWVVYEYQTTSLPPNQRNYVICKVMYKDVDGNGLYGNNSNELNHSIVSASNTARVINTTTPEVEQPREEDFYMSRDDLANPLNEQDDPSPFDPDTFINYDYCPHQQPETEGMMMCLMNEGKSKAVNASVDKKSSSSMVKKRRRDGSLQRKQRTEEIARIHRISIS
ncbi:hypothetical protein F2Q70_00045447 [Brassica cretica]|uniref:NAC domain-containing protein n=1 Tax=Brassica cretica TaxID=69181 RepID=A0A8S9KL52_BRACR|nr:hypothetical protein F2Q70_00045447 [Brassica cretica]